MVDRLLFDHKTNSTINNILYRHTEISIFSSKIEIYNPDADEPLQKFWFKIDKAKLLKNNKDHLIITLFNKDTQLVECLNSLDSKINEIVKKISKIIDHDSSLIIKEGFPPSMNILINSDTKAFDKLDNNINCSDIKNNANISLYMELESVYLNGKNDKKKWKILQIKENQVFDEQKSFFSNPNPLQQSFNYNTYNPPHPPPPPPPQPLNSKLSQNYQPLSIPLIQKSNINTNTNRLILSESELLNMKLKLKSVKDFEENENKNKNKDKDKDKFINREIGENPISRLNKVVTKESNIVDIFRQEYQNKKKDIEHDSNDLLSIEDTDGSIYNFTHLTREEIQEMYNEILRHEKKQKKDKIDKKYKKLIKKCKKTKFYYSKLIDN